jgi:YaiO family outer membrane protein
MIRTRIHPAIPAALLTLSMLGKAVAQDADSTANGAVVSSPRNGLADVSSPRQDASWIFTTIGSYGWLTGGRANWIESNTELLYRATPALYAGARVETRDREHETDVLYTVLGSYLPLRSLETHAAVTAVSNPAFSVDQAYTAGAAWRATARLSALFDYTRFEFPAGPIDQYQPGMILWFTERDFLTARYARGRAFGESDYEAYLVRLDLGLPRSMRLALSFAHGTEPEKDLGIPSVILTRADYYSLYGHVPLNRSLELILGAEYEDRDGIYTRTTAAAGISVRF